MVWDRMVEWYDGKKLARILLAHVEALQRAWWTKKASLRAKVNKWDEEKRKEERESGIRAKKYVVLDHFGKELRTCCLADLIG
jgi:hypothetical protein